MAGSHIAVVVAAWMLASFALSALVTVLAIGYARRRQMLDLPGQRRSHTVPTPRGGGLGIVVAVLLIVIPPLVLLSRDARTANAAVLTGLALLVVAAAGWIDDHGGLRARYRFAAHCMAAGVLLVSALDQVSLIAAIAAPPGWWMLTIIVGLLVGVLLAIVWSINLHNFMDGIDGLLAVQSIFVFVALGSVGLMFGSSSWWAAGLAAAAAVLGFLPFNFPRARIFMGDVGSGALGLLVAVAVLYQIGDPLLDAATGLIACSAFATDATATLLSRMLRGRRWYDAHREHLYQGLVRSGYSHAHVVGLYLGWDLLVALPAMLLIQSPRSVMAVDSIPLQAVSLPLSARSLVVLLAVYVFALATWVLGKRHCLHRSRQGGQHGLA